MTTIETISLDKSFHLSVLKLHTSPVITNADLYQILLDLYKNKEFEGVKIGKILKDKPDDSTFRNKVGLLEQNGVLTPLIDNKAYVISGKGNFSAEQAGCYLYLFSNLCYLSAMDYHGLTERIPKVIQIMIPSKETYKDLLHEKYSDSDIEENTYLKQRSIEIRKKIENKTFQYYKSKNFTVFKEIPDSGGVRVSPIGKTFLDMLQNPDECGGLSHVIDVFEENFEDNKRLIIKEFDKNGKAIDKARLGFIIESLLGISDQKFDEWANKAQRGGSRKLSPKDEFSPYFSERWCISINLERFEKYGTRN
ncbi:type IV toxin-antitoxin system AbiEi family antitoxin domain-containing protein [Marinomonas sp. ef1]|uniref:type IV toxin-antitoxin system AbiEi family antitoxin domain-containing protein n=1 Tax=Marinomonas sp. ef1 TaxID=2005043 RepID=UPI000C28DC5E|nr:type IV toxin-antitoxin system AbiEi family antitoxin [Marinomonas sp. ef1]